MHHRRSDVVQGQHEDGASLVEYGLMIALIAVVCFAAVTVFGNGGEGLMARNGECIAGAMDGALPADCN